MVSGYDQSSCRTRITSLDSDVQLVREEPEGERQTEIYLRKSSCSNKAQAAYRFQIDFGFFLRTVK